MSTSDEEASISIPSIAFVAVLGFLIYRYFFSSSRTANSTTNSSTSRTGAGQRFTTAQVDQVSAMFPQLNRRDIMWDLHRNRGSVQATTDRVLSGGRLEPAPPSFQPPLPTPIPQSSTLLPTTPSLPIKKPTVEPDLITRYNLQSKVDDKGKGKEKEEPSHGWATSKDERAAMLQRRRDEMILAARRKMLERDAGAGTGTGTGTGGTTVAS